MVWDPNFPLQTTNINQSTLQIRTNWNFLATSIGTDHYYNTGAPNEGHHRFVQMPNSVATPALAAGMNGVIANTTEGIAATIPSWPRFRNSTANYSTALVEHRQFNAAVATVVNLFKFVGSDFPVCGTFFATAGGLDFATCNYTWDNIRLTITSISTGVGSSIGPMSVNGPGNTIQVLVSIVPITISWTRTIVPYGAFTP